MPDNRPVILYIDDDAHSRSLIQRILEQAGYVLWLAESAMQGLDIAREQTPDIILTDLSLPDMNGHEVAVALRNDRRFANVPIIALTTAEYGEEYDVVRALGMNGFVRKPVDVDELPTLIRHYLHGAHDEEVSLTSLYSAQRNYISDLVNRFEARTRDLEHANDSLMRLDSTKEIFTELVAHELRTPLTSLSGYSNLLKTYPAVQSAIENDVGLKEVIQGLVDTSARMQTIINEIVTVSRILTDTMELKVGMTSLRQIMEKTLVGYDQALKDRRLKLHFNLDKFPNKMHADAELLRLAFSNLLGNAIKYTPDGGDIYLQCEVKGDDALITVRDTGVGIDPAERKHIFDHFHTTGDISLHSTSKTAFGGGGIGLGLPVCKAIIEAHGGDIQVDSPGRNDHEFPGSTFRVRLPLTATGYEMLTEGEGRR
jgi:signal transduction histidine kinase